MATRAVLTGGCFQHTYALGGCLKDGPFLKGVLFLSTEDRVRTGALQLESKGDWKGGIVNIVSRFGFRD